MLFGFAVTATVLIFAWPRGLYPLLAYVWFVFRFLHDPLGAFGVLAAVVFAAGWSLRWPAQIARCRPWIRGTTTVVLAFVLHGLWFLFSWVTFHPTCSYDVGVSLFTTGRVTLIGDLDTDYADRFEDVLADAWGRAAVAREDTHTVLVRPVFALLDDEKNESLSYRVAGVTTVPLLGDESLEPCRTVERNAMAGGEVDDWRDDWGLWPWNTIDVKGAFARWLRGLYR
jgi:hypothetical protein